MKKYIYLDWNVYKYLKKSRLEERDKSGHDADIAMRTLVSKLANSYCFPYSEGHIKDASNKYNPEMRDFIEDDFRFAETINHQECIGYGNNGSELIFNTQKKPMLEFFDGLLGSDPITENVTINALSRKC